MVKLFVVVMYYFKEMVDELENVDGFNFLVNNEAAEETDGFPWLKKKTKASERDAALYTNSNVNDQGVSITETRILKDSYVFPMNYRRRGVAMLFNHYKFTDMNARTGTDKDEKNLKKQLKALQFDVKVYKDLKYGEIYETLQNAAGEEYDDAGCLMVIVLTHGESNVLYAYDHKYPADILWTPFIGNKCPSLAGKPKIFLIQACRGEEVDSGVTLRSAALLTDSASPSPPTYTIPAMADILIMYSTYDGYYSWRSPLEGSWFIQCLCKELERNASRFDFVTILTFVNRRMAVDFESNVPDAPGMHAKKQIGSIVSTLTRLFYFFENNLMLEES